MSNKRLLAGVAAATAVLLALPFDANPLRRLANFHADCPDPLYDRPIDGQAVRDAGAALPDDATYILVVRGDPVLQGNLKAAAQVFFAPALPVQGHRDAEWIVAYADGEFSVRPR